MPMTNAMVAVTIVSGDDCVFFIQSLTLPSLLKLVAVKGVLSGCNIPLVTIVLVNCYVQNIAPWCTTLGCIMGVFILCR